MDNRGHQKYFWEMKTYLLPDKDESVPDGNILVRKKPLIACTHSSSLCHYVGGLKPRGLG